MYVDSAAERMVSEAVVCMPQVRCSEKFCKFDRETSALESLFNKAAGLKACNSIKKRLQHSYFPVKFAKCLRTPFLQKSPSGCF